MRVLIILSLFICLSAGAQDTAASHRSPDYSYFKSNLLLGGFASLEHAGAELGVTTAFGFKAVTAGALLQVQRHEIFQMQMALLFGFRVKCKKLKCYFSAGPGKHKETDQYTIYYAPQNKWLGYGTRYAYYRGLFLHTEVVKSKDSNGLGFGGYTTVFIGDGMYSIGVGINFMLGTRQY